jgi:peptide/nickel transport system permease protein
MLAYLLRRFAFALLLVFTVSSAALILVKVAPGDYVDTTAAVNASAATKDAMRERLGLRRTIAQQYGAWIVDAVRLDFGTSMMYRSPVRGLVRESAINTAILAATALLAATFIGLPLGIISGSRRGLLADAIRTASIVMLSLPPLLSSLVLLAIAAGTGWLPVGDMRSAGGSAWPLLDLLRHLIV